MPKGGLSEENVGPESVLRMDTIGNLRRMGWAVWSFEQNRRTRQTAGIADLLVQRGSALVAIELKAGSNTPTDMQWTFLEAFRETGNHAVVAWSFAEILWALARIPGHRMGLDPGALPDTDELSSRFLEAWARLYPDQEVQDE